MKLLIAVILLAFNVQAEEIDTDTVQYIVEGKESIAQTDVTKYLELLKNKDADLAKVRTSWSNFLKTSHFNFETGETKIVAPFFDYRDFDPSDLDKYFKVVNHAGGGRSSYINTVTGFNDKEDYFVGRKRALQTQIINQEKVVKETTEKMTFHKEFNYPFLQQLTAESIAYYLYLARKSDKKEVCDGLNRSIKAFTILAGGKMTPQIGLESEKIALVLYHAVLGYKFGLHKCAGVYAYSQGLGIMAHLYNGMERVTKSSGPRIGIGIITFYENTSSFTTYVPRVDKKLARASISGFPFPVEMKKSYSSQKIYFADKSKVNSKDIVKEWYKRVK